MTSYPLVELSHTMDIHGLYGFYFGGKSYEFHNIHDSDWSGLGRLIVEEVSSWTAEVIERIKEALETIELRSFDDGCDDSCCFEGLEVAALHPERFAHRQIEEKEPQIDDYDYMYIIDFDNDLLIMQHGRVQKRVKLALVQPDCLAEPEIFKIIKRVKTAEDVDNLEKALRLIVWRGDDVRRVLQCRNVDGKSILCTFARTDDREVESHVQHELLKVLFTFAREYHCVASDPLLKPHSECTPYLETALHCGWEPSLRGELCPPPEGVLFMLLERFDIREDLRKSFSSLLNLYEQVFPLISLTSIALALAAGMNYSTLD